MAVPHRLIEFVGGDFSFCRKPAASAFRNARQRVNAPANPLHSIDTGAFKP